MLAACGQSAGTPEGPLSVEEALATDTDQPVVVEGFLLAADGTVQLCGAVLESYPPQCGQPAITVHGLDLTTVEGLEMARGVSWAQGVELTGVVDDGTLTVR